MTEASNASLDSLASLFGAAELRLVSNSLALLTGFVSNCDTKHPSIKLNRSSGPPPRSNGSSSMLQKLSSSPEFISRSRKLPVKRFPPGIGECEPGASIRCKSASRFWIQLAPSHRPQVHDLGDRHPGQLPSRCVPIRQSQRLQVNSY